MRPYEIVYILDPALEREAVEAKLATFHAALGGQITAFDHWGVRQLAYPIGKSSTGYYVIVQVTTDATALPEFERLLKLDEETMRYLIVHNDGQPTSGASVLGDVRPTQAVEAPPVDDAEGEDKKDGDDGDDEDEEEEKDEEDQAAAAWPPDSSGPPEFSGARGRRRRHEGPPIVHLNYKDVTTLARFLTEQGKILPRRTTKVPARFQRQLGTAVKRARFVALLPYIRDHEG